MTNSDTHLTDSEFRKEELKTVKSRRRLYTSTFIIVLFALLYLLGQAAQHFGHSRGHCGVDDHYRFLFEGPGQLSGKQGHWSPVGNVCGLYSHGRSGNSAKLDAFLARVRRW